MKSPLLKDYNALNIDFPYWPIYYLCQVRKLQTIGYIYFDFVRNGMASCT